MTYNAYRKKHSTPKRKKGTAGDMHVNMEKDFCSYSDDHVIDGGSVSGDSRVSLGEGNVSDNSVSDVGGSDCGVNGKA